jgi:hypothetical protein
MIEAHLPVRIWENSTIMELDSSVGLTVAPASAEMLVDDSPVLHVRGEQAQWQFGDLRPGHMIALGHLP